MHPGEHTTDAIKLLSRAQSRAARLDHGATGTEHLLFAMLDAGTPTARALAPGARDAGRLMGVIASLDPPHWVSEDDETASPDVEADAMVTAALREAHFCTRKRGRIPGEPPPATPALRACLRGALVHAGPAPVLPSHLLLGLLDLRGSRAVDALRLRRIDRDAVAAAVDPAREEPAAHPSVALLRKSGVFGGRTRFWMRWLSSGFGSPVLMGVVAEATRQAVRRGGAEVEPVDLLLGVLSLDGLVEWSGDRLPDRVAAEVLKAHGVDLPGLLPVVRVPAVPLGESVPLGEQARRSLTAARLRVADRGSEAVGTGDLVVTLLDEIGPLLAGAGHDVRALRAALAG
ncbi:Clp protease N-terminal domain-containing protein [Umezawaea endophytica]|uniref:Clp protease N-terminal domain-containing protein n=1 Tax=Umezawaea endophytica TaxID=1654476 RepID=A0A9X2VSW4_9PSEU|nr:Clp protease N-terminal domain-containing protein [Umezawaea endophytica]MCS7480968.1 Clp protease N-terminal domain-containing protein [Umezawaea endophytica]